MSALLLPAFCLFIRPSVTLVIHKHRTYTILFIWQAHRNQPAEVCSKLILDISVYPLTPLIFKVSFRFHAVKCRHCIIAASSTCLTLILQSEATQWCFMFLLDWSGWEKRKLWSWILYSDVVVFMNLLTKQSRIAILALARNRIDT